MISVEEALRQVLAHAERLPAEQVTLAQANGRVLAADLKSLRTQPPADVSAMDGYAVRASDVATAPVRLKVIGEVAAGRPFAQTVGAGEAARIFTGGVLPDGADTVVVQEQTARDGDLVEIQKASAPARHVRRKGLDFRAGETALPAGHHLRPRDLQLVAGMNYPNVPVYRRAENRDVRNRRRAGAARRRARPGPDRLFQRLRARGAGAPGRRRGHRSWRRRRPA